jgi:glycine cleavage system protein P-like pyridoxal-binding family
MVGYCANIQPFRVGFKQCAQELRGVGSHLFSEGTNLNALLALISPYGLAVKL